MLDSTDIVPSPVYAMRGREVKTVITDGRVAMEHCEMKTVVRGSYQVCSRDCRPTVEELGQPWRKGGYPGTEAHDGREYVLAN